MLSQSKLNFNHPVWESVAHLNVKIKNHPDIPKEEKDEFIPQLEKLIDIFQTTMTEEEGNKYIAMYCIIAIRTSKYF